MDMKDTKALIEDNSSNLSEYERIDLLRQINDFEYVREYVKKYIKDNSRKLYSEDLLDYIELTKDTEYIKKWLNNKDSGLDEVENMKLLLSTKNEKFIYSYLEENKQNLSEDAKNLIELNLSSNEIEDKENGRKSLELPTNMTIGIEIESEGQFSQLLPSEIMGWNTKPENTLYNGIEVVSPPLTSTKENTKQIYSVCYALKGVGQTISQKCAGYVHIGANYLKSKQAYINLLEIVGNTEDLIYIISNRPGENLREGISEYSVPISKKLESEFENNKVDVTDGNVPKFVEKIKRVQGNRFSGINFKNVNTDKNTIEFRVANGTLDPDICIENVNLFGGIIRVSQELAEIQDKKREDLTEEECMKIDNFRKLKSEGIEKNEKLNLLLSLTVREKDSYLQRYEVNKELVEDDFVIDEILDDARLNKPLNIKTIGKSVFTGIDAVRGEEIKKMEKEFYFDIEKLQGLNIDEKAI